jgi:deoxyribonucleoside regulator
MPRKRARTTVHATQADDFLADVARAYYEQHLTQEEVAVQFGVSRSQVSRYLQEAHSRDIVQIRIVPAGARDTAAEDRLREAFPHLVEVVVAQVFGEGPETVRWTVARAAARFLDRTVTSAMTVCFGAGRTLANTVELLSADRVRNVTVAQAMGNAGHEGLAIDYNAIASVAATAFGGRAYQINAPAILGPGMKAGELEASNPQIRESLRLARSADLYVLGVGSIVGDVIYVQTGLLTFDDLAALKAAGAVGDICGNFFDARGRPCPGPFQDRLVGIRLQDLRRAPTVVACAAGPEKVPALAGALTGRLINVLITDEQTARGMLELLGPKHRELIAARQ